MMNIVVWWNIPCKAVTGLFKYLSKIENVNLVLITGKLNRSRIEMGWEIDYITEVNHIILDDDEWEVKSKILLEKHCKYLHIFGGLYFPPRMFKLIKYAENKKINFGIFEEPYFNPYSGVKGIMAGIYHSLILPIKSRNIANAAQFVFCLTGSSQDEIEKLRRLGLSKDKIVPFGYFLEDHFNLRSRTQNEIPNIFCPGNLVPYKGVDVLLQALNVLNKKGLNFHCHITGKGTELNFLIDLCAKFGLNSKVTFHGVLKQSDFDLLQSQMDILVAPGRTEPWGIRINEAIQCGQVVIVSDKIGAKELIEASGGGEIFKSDNFSDLASKLTPYLVNKTFLQKSQELNIMYKRNIDPKLVCKYVIEAIVAIHNNNELPIPIWLKN